MATKPSIPKGTRDFSPVEMLRRKYIFSTIEKVFQKYGFLPLETPAMENLETLTGKYGEEGDRLIFKILKRGFTLDGAVAESVEATSFSEDKFLRMFDVPTDDARTNLGLLKKELSEQFPRRAADAALRYDLTVPFARYVVMNQNELAFPFKRYQIQPVWRADRPQKGRYREFYQCDADVIGSNSLLNEAELLFLIVEVFDALGLKVKVHVNNRKVLRGMAEFFKVEDRLIEFLIIMDKADKIGVAGIQEEYRKAGFPEDVISNVMDLYVETSRASTPEDMINMYTRLRGMFQESGSSDGVLGLEEMETLFKYCKDFLKSEPPVVHDFTLARGLDYYTGAIFEVKALEGTLQSSICGGGRYDDLTGVFGLKGMSGVGISFGADRIYDVLLETNKFPKELGASTKLLFANFGEAEAMHCLKLLRQVREAGIAAELYPDEVKLPKQFTYAEKKGIPFVAIVGGSEMEEGRVTLKRMGANEKGSTMSIEEVIEALSR